MFKSINLLCVFFVIAMSAYSQKEDCFRPFYVSGDRIIYTDSTVVNDVAVYTDSLIVDISVVYTDSIIVEGSVIYTDSTRSYHVDYPITLTGNPPFKKAFYRDSCEFIYQIRWITFNLWGQQRTNSSNEKKGYYILSANGRFIHYAFLTKEDGELYTKYNPIAEDKKGSFSFSERQYGKLLTWIQQEMDKGLIVSLTIDGKSMKRYRYVTKLFSDK
jgi:hypothetical protein